MSNVKLKIMKEKLFKIAKILVNREIRAYNERQSNDNKGQADLECIVNDLEKEILIRSSKHTYLINAYSFVTIAEGVGANYYVDVTKTTKGEPVACIVIYF